MGRAKCGANVLTHVLKDIPQQVPLAAQLVGHGQGRGLQGD